MSWKLADNPEVCVGGGPVEHKVGETVVWDIHSKQGVHFFQSPSNKAKSINIEVKFSVQEGDLEFKIDRVFD